MKQAFLQRAKRVTSKMFLNIFCFFGLCFSQSLLLGLNYKPLSVVSAKAIIYQDWLPLPALCMAIPTAEENQWMVITR